MSKRKPVDLRVEALPKVAAHVSWIREVDGLGMPTGQAETSLLLRGNEREINALYSLIRERVELIVADEKHEDAREGLLHEVRAERDRLRELLAVIGDMAHEACP